MKIYIKVILIIIFIFLFRRILKFGHKNNLILYHNENELNLKHVPKISVIMPIYNGGKYLNYSLKSVQNQNMKDIEIIIIDDNSSDDSVKIIHDYMENDERIKLIENKVNRKILFCKSIGTLNSKGKYIIELDQDDMFLRDDAFDIIYNESEKYELDVLGFRHFSGDNPFQKFKLKNYENDINNIVKQPEIKLNMFKSYICLLWGNLIRADLYKKVIYNLWPIIINYKIIFQEDYLITFFVLIYAKKYKKIRNRILFHFKNIKSASKGYKNNSEYFLSVIFAGIIFYDYHIDYYSQDIPIIINYINYLDKHFERAKEFYPSFFDFFLGKILSNPYLSIKERNSLQKKFKILDNCCSYEHSKRNHTLILNNLSNGEEEPNNNLTKIYKISLIIIIHSNFENILRLINSINAQSFQFFQIILIYDDNKREKIYDIIKNYSVKYKNIELIDNKFKKGAMFSISKGVMNAKGKYLMILDEKSFFLENNVFKIIYEEMEEKELDILEFDLYKTFANNYMNLYKCNHFSSQFNLSQIKYNLEFKGIDINKELLTNKIIKTKYFINILKKFKLNEINDIIDNYYNNIFIFCLESNTYKYAHTSLAKIYINDADFDKFKFNDFSSEKEKIIIKEITFYINFIFENSPNTYERKANILNELYKDLSIIFNKFSKVSESSIELLNKFMYCNYISDANKNSLQFYYISLIK